MRTQSYGGWCCTIQTLQPQLGMSEGQPLHLVVRCFAVSQLHQEWVPSKGGSTVTEMLIASLCVDRHESICWWQVAHKLAGRRSGNENRRAYAAKAFSTISRWRRCVHHHVQSFQSRQVILNHVKHKYCRPTESTIKIATQRWTDIEHPCQLDKQ